MFEIMQESIIQVENVSKVYNPNAVEVHAVNEVSVGFSKGEFTAIVGPSGSGKTTLLNLIGGLDQPTSGRVIIDGTAIHELNENNRINFRRDHIGFVFQAYNLIPVLTAYENAEFVMLLQDRPENERKARVQSLLEAVGLGDLLNNKPGQLSGGQQQRVAVVRALAPKPSFILADEPTANLDSHSTAALLDLMANLNQKEGVTFLFSTHDQRVMERAHRIVTLTDGKISSDETIR